VTFKFWEMLKKASEVTLRPNFFFSLKILMFVQSFVKCKVSLADGILVSIEQKINSHFATPTKSLFATIVNPIAVRSSGPSAYTVIAGSCSSCSLPTRTRSPADKPAISCCGGDEQLLLSTVRYYGRRRNVRGSK
jgi:hypothetical protein